MAAAAAGNHCLASDSYWGSSVLSILRIWSRRWVKMGWASSSTRPGLTSARSGQIPFGIMNVVPKVALWRLGPTSVQPPEVAVKNEATKTGSVKLDWQTVSTPKDLRPSFLPVVLYPDNDVCRNAECCSRAVGYVEGTCTGLFRTLNN
jgi:hypothetical protein